MIIFEQLIGNSIGDSQFIDFWGEIDESELPLEVEGEYILSQPKRGISALINQDLEIEAVTLFSGKQQGANRDYKIYKGDLPDGVKFGMKKAKLVSLLGLPSKENLKFEMFMGVEIYPWVYFDKKNYALNIEFNKRGKVTVVTIMRKGLV